LSVFSVLRAFCTVCVIAELFATIVKVKFVAKLGKMGDEKIHVLVPKEHWEMLRPLIRKQVRVTIEL
jgi:hypothetical protein